MEEFEPNDLGYIEVYMCMSIQSLAISMGDVSPVSNYLVPSTMYPLKVSIKIYAFILKNH